MIFAVAAWSKACVCDGWLAGIAGSYPAVDMGFCLLWVLRVRWMSLRVADRSLRGVLASVVCLSETVKPL
jgi:hypothetical protein